MSEFINTCETELKHIKKALKNILSYKTLEKAMYLSDEEMALIGVFDSVDNIVQILNQQLNGAKNIEANSNLTEILNKNGISRYVNNQ